MKTKENNLHLPSELDQSFWNQRWLNNETGWDTGIPSPAITDYFIQEVSKESSILIPGCGNAHEALFLIQNGFLNITLIDIAPKAVEILRKKFEAYPSIRIHCEDFFEHQGKYDYIIEQTFFCTLISEKRKEYAKKTSELLTEGGRVIGLLFNRNFEQPGPPFGGDIQEYQSIFEPYFHIKKMEMCTNSIYPRRDTELFLNLIRK